MRDQHTAELTCPHCQGRKTSLCLVHYVDGVASWIDSQCSTCGGAGIVTAERAEKIARGREIRGARIAKGEYMHVAAERMGMSVQEYSRYERGLE